MRRMRFAVGCAVALGSAALAPGGIFSDLYQGLDFLATPSGFPLSGSANGGLQNGARFGRVRIVPNEFGQGYRLEFDRAFGNDALGRPEIFDFGNTEVQLSGSIDLTAAITTRGIPTFDLTSGAANLAYSVRGKSGAQDAELRGTLNAASSFEVNPLGFYTYSLAVTNANSDLLLDGVLAEGQEDSDFDIGPINVRGNIYIDGLSALLRSFGVDTSQIEGAFADSPIDRIGQDISAALSARLAEVTPGGLTTLDQPTLASSTNVELVAADVGPQPLSSPVPEPAAIALLLGGALLVGARRR